MVFLFLQPPVGKREDAHYDDTDKEGLAPTREYVVAEQGIDNTSTGNGNDDAAPEAYQKFLFVNLHDELKYLCRLVTLVEKGGLSA